MNMMLNRNVLCYFRNALFYRQLLIHKCRHTHNYVSVKQALQTVPSGSIPVLIQVRRSSVDAVSQFETSHFLPGAKNKAFRTIIYVQQ